MILKTCLRRLGLTYCTVLHLLLHRVLVKVRLFLVFLSPSSPNHVTHANSERYVPLGYSRKFWYSDNLSAEVSSITSPSGQKRLYLDPNQVSLVKGKKAVIIDDAVSSGTTLKSTWDFLEGVGCEILVCGVVMKQGERWKGVLGPERTGKVVWVFESPLLRKVEGGWGVRE